MGRRFGLMRGGGSCVSLAASRFLPSPSSLRFCTSITCIGLIGPDVWRSTWRGRHPVLPLIIVKKCLIAFQHVHPMGNRSHPPHRITGVSVWQARCIWQTTLPLMLKRYEREKISSAVSSRSKSLLAQLRHLLLHIDPHQPRQVATQNLLLGLGRQLRIAIACHQVFR